MLTSLGPRARWVLVVAALFTLIRVVVQVPTTAQFMRDFDWGVQLAGANQILFGEHPFVDFRSLYGPLAFYASAAAQLLSGGRVVGEIVLVAAGYVVAYVLLVRLMWQASGRISVAVVLLVIALLTFPRIYKYYIVLGPMLILSAAWHYQDHGGRRALVLLALAITVAGLFRPDIGVYGLICGGCAVGTAPAAEWTVRRRRLLGFAAAVAACALPWLAWLCWHGRLIDYFRDSIVGAFGVVDRMSLPLPMFRGDLPLRSDHNLIFFTFVLFHAVPVLSLLLVWWRPQAFAGNERQKIGVLALLALFTLLQSAHRAGYVHLLQSIGPCYVLVAWLAASAIESLRHGDVVRRSVAAVGLGVGVCGVLMLHELTTAFFLWPRPDLTALAHDLRDYSAQRDVFLERAQRRRPDDWLIHAVQFVRAHTERTEKILALPLMPNFYYLADRPFGGGQMLVAPGLFCMRHDEQRMLARIDEDHIVIVVCLPRFQLDARDDRMFKSYSPLVYAHLDEAYIELERFGPMVVKSRRE